MSIGSVNSGQQYGPAQSGPSNTILLRYYRQNLKDELELAQRAADAGDSAQLSKLAPIIQNDAQQAALDKSLSDSINSSLQNQDGEGLKADKDVLIALNDPKSPLASATNPSPQPMMYNQSNTAGFSGSPSPTDQSQQYQQQQYQPPSMNNGMMSPPNSPPQGAQQGMPPVPQQSQLGQQQPGSPQMGPQQGGTGMPPTPPGSPQLGPQGTPQGY